MANPANAALFQPTRRKTRSLSKTIGWTLLYIVLGLTALSMLVPFLWMLFTSFKPQQEIFKMPPIIFTTHYTLAHYVKALTQGNFLLYFKNSMVVSVWTTVLTVVVTSLAGYAFARLKWRLREEMFMVILSVMMLPGLIALIPTFLIVKATPFAGGNNWLGVGGNGWLDSFPGLIIPAVGGGFYVFLLRQFFRSIPAELTEAARMDGTTEFDNYWRIVLPLAKPALWTVGLFAFIGAWNDYLGPLIYLFDDRKYTLSLGLAMFRTQYGAEWGQMMAVSTVVTLPLVVLFFFTQRTFVQGITMTGIKG
jgi:multiple sugar transport system permease protein